MPDSSHPDLRLTTALRHWFAEQSGRNGTICTLKECFHVGCQFLRDSLPARRRQRYGDVDYDWDHRVDTTSATVSWRDRLLGLLHSPYQPTDPALFHEMLASLNLEFRDFIFIDIGSGKGRTLLMASDYPFRRILGVELLPELHRVAQENLRIYKSDSQQCFEMESVCCDAREFTFPLKPTVLYLFNPLPEAGLMQLLANLHQSLREHPRPVFVIYHNPALAHLLTGSVFRKLGATHQYAVYTAMSLERLP